MDMLSETKCWHSRHPKWSSRQLAAAVLTLSARAGGRALPSFLQSDSEVWNQTASPFSIDTLLVQAIDCDIDPLTL